MGLCIIKHFWISFEPANHRDNEQLIRERAKPGPDIKSWDKTILGFSAVVTVVAYIVAGLDAGRFHWSPELNSTYFILGVFLVLTGQIFFLYAKKQNTFFSSVARIQTERAHAVCNSGVYRFVRHPGYLGMIISWAGFPLIFSSIYSFIPAAIAISLLVLRTALEDEMLDRELDGYKGYIEETKYKLIPFLW